MKRKGRRKSWEQVVSLVANNLYKVTWDDVNHHHQDYELWPLLQQREVSPPTIITSEVSHQTP
eukprot:8236481-Ditylum_brightwellii.AAC.1